MYGYNEIEEARRVHSMVICSKSLARHFCEHISDTVSLYNGLFPDAKSRNCSETDVWYLLWFISVVGMMILETNSFDGVWNTHFIDLLTNEALDYSDTERISSDEFTQNDSIFHTSHFPERDMDILKNAYLRLEDSETLKAVLAFSAHVSKILKLDASVSIADESAFQSAVNEYQTALLSKSESTCSGMAEHPLLNLFNQLLEENRMDALNRQNLAVYDQEISYVERMARSRSHREPSSRVKEVVIPEQILEKTDNAEMMLFLSLIYKALKKQGVTANDLKPHGQNNYNYWPIPGGKKGFAIYTSGYTSDTYFNRVNKALQQFLPEKPPVRIVTWHQVPMIWMDPDVFSYFENANNGKEIHPCQQSIKACASGFIGSDEVIQEPVINRIIEKFPFPKIDDGGAIRFFRKSCIQPVVPDAVTTDNKKHRDAILFDDGGRMAYRQIVKLSSPERSEEIPDKTEQTEKKLFTMFIKRDASGTKADWLNNLSNLNQLFHDILDEGLRQHLLPASTVMLMTNYKRERVNRVLLGFLYYRNHMMNNGSAKQHTIVLPIQGELVFERDYDTFIQYRRWVISEQHELTIEITTLNNNYHLSISEGDSAAVRQKNSAQLSEADLCAIHTFLKEIDSNKKTVSEIHKLWNKHRAFLCLSAKLALRQLQNCSKSVYIQDKAPKNPAAMVYKVILGYLCYSFSKDKDRKLTWRITHAEPLENLFFENEMDSFIRYVRYLGEQRRQLIVKKDNASGNYNIILE